ncbi:hypothetical protein PF010_g27148 [Phytophthora fragariae]|uniref:Histone-lysine N-methyltransferase, H3 lysine-79 specific n=1 Tax=Phytophthora fragariae TaxID=53985 RepID=A0A6G0JUS2_9STRA|nr:hypothetical protein PF010_g27148 [Phytophthora fragariae]KAE9174778.1 hypothetical protein PF004_g26572 [Phytophthora fragariae]
MTPRRRPANRKGPRSLEHRKLKSPHALSPRSSTASVAPSPSSEMAEHATPPLRKMPTDAEATATVAAVMEDVLLRLEASGSASDTSSAASSSSSDGEMTHTRQRKRRKTEKTENEGEREQPQELRRSGRKRRTVDLLSPSEQQAARRSPLKPRRRAGDKMKKLLDTRPAAAEAAAVRAAAAAKEKKRERELSAAKRRKTAGANAKSETPNGVLSPMQDEQKKTPQKKRSGKARRSLEPAYSHDSEVQYVSDLIAELYEEQEQDDRQMYNITRETVLTETSHCKRSQEVEELSLEEFRRLMTYGEVSVESVASTILPFLNLEEDDVFFDLGCGTGKILVQAALQTPCKRTIGIELMQNRVVEGNKALQRLKERDVDILRGKQIELLQGDILEPPAEARLMDATVVFINNVMFGPTLMLKVLALLKDMSNLRCVVTLRKICERHGHEKCTRAGNYCVDYVHPPQEAEIDVSWADKTQVFLYVNVDYDLSVMRRRLASMETAR